MTMRSGQRWPWLRIMRWANSCARGDGLCVVLATNLCSLRRDVLDKPHDTEPACRCSSDERLCRRFE